MSLKSFFAAPTPEEEKARLQPFIDQIVNGTEVLVPNEIISISGFYSSPAALGNTSIIKGVIKALAEQYIIKGVIPLEMSAGNPAHVSEIILLVEPRKRK